MVTSPSTDNERAAIEERLSELSIFLDNAITQANQSNLIDLGSMENDIASLCVQIESSAPEVANEMKPLMANLIAKLDELAASIATYQTQMEEQKDDG